MIRVRELDKAEYGKLAEISEGYIPPEDSSLVLVAEENGEIVGRMMLLFPAHIEGTWVKEGSRNRRVGWKLMQVMEEKAATLGLGKLLAFAMEKTIEGYLERLRFKREPMSVWSKELTCLLP